MSSNLSRLEWSSDAVQVGIETHIFHIVQVEFLAEDEMINIIPNVRMATLHMICVCAISNCVRELPDQTASFW